MSMSTDVIEFTLGRNGHGLTDTRALDAAVKAFGFSHEIINQLRYREVVIRCRPSQFGRFIVYRDMSGATNGIKELNAKIIETRPETPKFFDVSKNPKG